MIKNIHRIFTITFGVFISLLVLITPISAQDQLNQPTLNENQTQNVPPVSVQTERRDEGFSWWWLLPLALLPLALLLFRRPEEERRRDTYREDVAYHDIDKTEAPYEEDEEEMERQSESKNR